MKPKFIIYLLGLLLLNGCVVASMACRQGLQSIADDALKAAQKARKAHRPDKAVYEAERAIQASRQAKETHLQAIQSAPHTQQSDEITRALQQLEQIELEAQIIKLEAQADNAVAVTTNKIKSGQGELARVSESELDTFLRDLLCFHLETAANEGRLPSDEDYQEFMQDYAITRFVPVWEIKAKAKNIIEFAENISKSRSPAEVRARVRLLQECTFRGGGN